MALAEETPRILHAGNGTRGPFPLSVSGTPITYADSSHIVVTRYDADGVGTLQTEGLHYTLSADSVLPDVGELVQTVTAASFTFESGEDVLASGEYVLAERVSPTSQDLVLPPSGGFPSAAGERTFDVVLRLIQELQNKLERVITLNPLDPDGAIALASAEARANTVIGFDEDGNYEALENTFTGAPGPQGDPGADGATWTSGSGAPSGGNDGDHYLNLTNGDVYRKDAGVWSVVGSIAGPSGAGTGDMLKSQNLSGLANVATARTNLGLGSAALLASSAVFQVANNLSEGNASAMRGNLGLGTAALLASSAVLQSANNLSDLANVTTARTSLGLGSAALLAEATTAEFLANTADKVLTTDQVRAAGAMIALTDAATIAVDMATGINFEVTLGGDRTLGAPTNVVPGTSGVIYVTQDGTGSRTLGYHANYKWPNSTAGVLSTTPGKIDRLAYFVRSSTFIELSLAKALG